MPLSKSSISAELARSPSTLSRAEATALVAYLNDIPVRTDWTAHELAALLFWKWLYPTLTPPPESGGPWWRRSSRSA